MLDLDAALSNIEPCTLFTFVSKACVLSFDPSGFWEPSIGLDTHGRFGWPAFGDFEDYDFVAAGI